MSVSAGKLRVLHLGKYYPPYKGGIESHLQTLCRELREHVELQVLVANDGAATVRDEDQGIPVTRVGTQFHLSAAPVSKDLIRHIKQAQADIVHLHWPHPTAALAYLASRQRGKLVITYHSDVVRQKLLGRAFDPFLLRCLKRTDAIIVTSPQYLASSPYLQKFQAKCHLIPFGIDLAQYSANVSENALRLRREYGDKIILSVGRLIYYKGFEYLIRAMREVDGRLLIIGKGRLEAELNALVARENLQDKVVLIGEAGDAEMLDYYQACQIFVLASIARSEAFGIVQLEAMACGKPVINTRLDSGVPFVSLNNVTGFTVEPENSAALAAAIQKLLTDPALQETMGKAARRRVEQEFSKEIMVEKTLNLYASLLRLR